MSVAKVLRLAEHRDKRSQRLALARTMFRADPARFALLEHFAEVGQLTGSDRVAAVWIDEYGPGLVHPYVVLDLLSDRPRRYFAVDPLQKAWDFGIPGAYDEAADVDIQRFSTFAIALGSDGSRAWFLVADSVTRRARLDPACRDRLMFLAGESSAVVLHRDLVTEPAGEAVPGFAGWHLLKDLEGHEDDEERGAVVGRRFEVGRLARMLVDEDLCVPEGRRVDLAERVRGTLADEPVEEPEERALLHAVLDAYQEGDLPALGSALIDAGYAAERVDHRFGALELYRCAYDIGAALGDAMITIEAARASGRVFRRRAQWPEADRWYGTALEIAERADVAEMVARSRSGLAIIQKERGDLTAARRGFEEALVAARRADDPDTTASIFHDLMGLEHAAGELPLAARHGWRAVNTYASETGRTRCMASFAAILKDLGDWDAAEDAYTVVSRTSDEHYYRVYAFDALAHMAALRGDEEAFERRASECDALGWEDGPLSAKAEILCYRGLSFRLLGRIGEARSWLERARAFAEEHGLNRVLIQAEEVLRELDGDMDVGSTPSACAPPEIRAGLRAMRDELLDIGA